MTAEETSLQSWLRQTSAPCEVPSNNKKQAPGLQVLKDDSSSSRSAAAVAAAVGPKWFGCHAINDVCPAFLASHVPSTISSLIASRWVSVCSAM